MMSKTTGKFSPEIREGHMRLIHDNAGKHVSRWQAISTKIGYAPQTLNDQGKKAGVNSGKQAGVSRARGPSA